MAIGIPLQLRWRPPAEAFNGLDGLKDWHDDVMCGARLEAGIHFQSLVSQYSVTPNPSILMQTLKVVQM